jgi:phenylalanyl-tRNA synthetase beta chain
MKLSRNFLKDYLDIDNISFKDIADKMVLVGNEFEKVESLSKTSNVVVGHVLECIKHPESNKLSVCKVDIGEVKQIVCGASNVKEGAKVVVAKVGAILPDKTEIKHAILAGYDSEGMICSLEELGIESKYMSEVDKTGIHILPSDAEIGIDAITYLNYDDETISFELTSNRADLLSVIGMAYEVGAILNKKVKLPKIKYNTNKENIKNIIDLSVKTDKCPLYLGKVVKNLTIKESPNFIKARLIASGIRPINNLVDISNYIMLETGQPLHFFDLDKLEKNITVEIASEGSITTLDKVERKLKDDLVIKSGANIVALAGVMGASLAEVSESTKNIFIEAAIFDSKMVRNTAKKTLRSESSNRFEKGIDPNITNFAIERACTLLSEYAGGLVVNGTLEHREIAIKEKEIVLSLDKINQVLGMSLTKEDVMLVLERLAFDFEFKKEFKIEVPTRRLDINIKEDIIEEIGRIYGYDKLEGKLPLASIKRGTYSKKYSLIKEIKNRLMGMGLNEVITYSLVKENKEDFILDKKEDVIITNYMSEDKKVMRQSLIPGLIEVFEYNNARNVSNINLFEVGSIYYKEDNYLEKTYLSGLLYGNHITNNWQQNTIKVDFYLVKGIIENMLSYLGLDNRYYFKAESLKGYHPKKTAAIYVDNVVVGYIGQIDPRINKKEIYIFEINLDLLMSFKVRNIKYKELSKYPVVNRDLAFIVNNDISAKMVYDVIKKSAGKLLVDLDLFDLYKMNDAEKSLAFSLSFQDSQKTLNEEEINNMLNKIIEDLKEKTGAIIRSK